jgi:hypothetical protein
MDVDRDGVGDALPVDSGEPGGEEPDTWDGATWEEVDDARKREGTFGLLN